MSKKVFVIAIIVAVFALTCIFLLVNQPAPERKDIAEEIGTTIHESMAKLWAEDKEKNTLHTSSKTKMFAIIQDEQITQAYFDVRVALYQSIGSTNPELDAWESLKMEVAEKKFAEEHGILPTKEEIMTFTKEMRAVTESTEESYAIGKTLIGAAGMTWEQYWHEYKPKYESPAHLTKIHIIEYLEKNNLPDIDTNKIEYEILNKEYQQLLSI